MKKQLLFGALLLQTFPAALQSSGTNPTSPLPLTLTVLALTTARAANTDYQDNSHYQPVTRFAAYPGKNIEHKQNGLLQKNKKTYIKTKFPKKNIGEKLRKTLPANQ